jgi:hypothetical protein
MNENGMDEVTADAVLEQPAMAPDVEKPTGPSTTNDTVTVGFGSHMRTSRPRALRIPDDLLEAARRGMTPRAIAQILSARLDRPVSGQAIYAKLVKLGIRHPRPVPYEMRSGEPVLTMAEHERLEDYHRRRNARICALLTTARTGDRNALTVLHTEFGLRLPLVEARMSPALPWMLHN